MRVGGREEPAKAVGSEDTEADVYKSEAFMSAVVK
jgi:hypothetical protein